METTKTHEQFMQRCLQLAEKGLGSTYPNPMVGAVLVHEGLIIGEGWHQKAGAPHAEVNAIASVTKKSGLKEATIYVSLEPCSHFGKTPPCSDLIIESGIPNVVIGTKDPFAKVQGRGIERLKSAGCNVTVGVLEAECKELNKRFFKFHNSERPFIILKWAQTADGYIAPKQRDSQAPVWITNRYSRQLTHKWRAEEQAILVGTQTAIEDNPSLTTRHWNGKNPLRLVIDRTQKLSQDLKIFDAEAKTHRFTDTNTDFARLPQAICDFCHKNNLQSLIVEGGTQTLQSFIDAGLWDEARVFEGAANFKDGVKSPSFNASLVSSEAIMEDVLKLYKNQIND